MAGWNYEGKVPKVSEAPDVPLWVRFLQAALMLMALGLGAWFGWMMF